jgi:predicted NUDIX family phosphoesterase
VSHPSRERVRVVPTAVFRAVGTFQGLCTDVDRYLPRLLDPAHLSFRPRDEVEADPSFKQLIPYVVLRWRDHLFHYTRGAKGTEARLRALRSVGVGGHINDDDGGRHGSPYEAGLRRELAEEVRLESAWTERCVGLINDDATPVGQVHLGIVHLLDLAEPRVRRREEALADSGLAPLPELRARRQEFETWSQFVLDAAAGWD